jgi:hypothetical protein
MPCTQCGLQLGADARFCPRCGQPVAQATAAPWAATRPAPMSPEPASPYATPAPPPAGPASPYDTPATPYTNPSSAVPPPPPAPGTWPPPPPYGQVPPPPGQHQMGYGQPPWLQPVPPAATNKLSTAAFICGGLAVLVLPIIFGVAAIICAYRAAKRKETRAGAAMAVAIIGTILGFIFGYFARRHYPYG